MKWKIIQMQYKFFVRTIREHLKSTGIYLIFLLLADFLMQMQGLVKREETIFLEPTVFVKVPYFGCRKMFHFFAYNDTQAFMHIF